MEASVLCDSKLCSCELVVVSLIEGSYWGRSQQENI